MKRQLSRLSLPSCISGSPCEQLSALRWRKQLHFVCKLHSNDHLLIPYSKGWLSRGITSRTGEDVNETIAKQNFFRHTYLNQPASVFLHYDRSKEHDKEAITWDQLFHRPSLKQVGGIFLKDDIVDSYIVCKLHSNHNLLILYSSSWPREVLPKKRREIIISEHRDHFFHCLFSYQFAGISPNPFA